MAHVLGRAALELQWGESVIGGSLDESGVRSVELKLASETITAHLRMGDLSPCIESVFFYCG